MITDTQKRSQLIRRIQRIPSNKLNELDQLISKLEASTSRKDKNLTYAGAWKDIDQETFDNLTVNLVEKRQRNRRRNE
jgi:hypothetical protein